MLPIACPVVIWTLKLPASPLALLQAREVSDTHKDDSQEVSPRLSALLLSCSKADEPKTKTIRGCSSPRFVEVNEAVKGRSKLSISVILPTDKPEVSMTLRDERTPAAQAHLRDEAESHNVLAVEEYPVRT